MKHVVLSFFLVILLVGCAKSPTGRTQVMLFSSQELNKMGAQSFEEMKQKQKISKNELVNGYVQCVSKSITKNVSKKVHAGTWEVVVFESEQINAFALPGGKIGVYTGLVDLAQNQHELAAVIGHEIAHVIANHSNERMSQNAGAQLLLQGTDAILTASGSKHRELILAGESLLVQYGFLLPFGRTHESEADIIGQELMAVSGYMPEASIALWRNMAKSSKGAPPEWLSTHPSHATRINNLSNHLEKSKQLFNQSGIKPDCFKPILI